MFTGIITDIGEVITVEPRAQGLAGLTIACGYDPDGIGVGASIACSGVCLTVVARGNEGNRGWFAVEAAAETLRLTTVGNWRRGTRINLERALKIGDELGGHMVAGHADGLAGVVTREDLTDMARFTLRAPQALTRFIAAKGSVALDGVSLTVNEVADHTFSVLIIPHTLKVTTLGSLAAGDAVNLEVDLMARYGAADGAAVRRQGGGELRSLVPTRSACYDRSALETGHGRASPLVGNDASDGNSGDLNGARILIVEARFYEDIADALLAGATRALQEAGAVFDRVSVPGSLEVAPAIAIAADAAERSGRPYDGAVALGCVIRGETLHFEIVSQESARALLELSVVRRLPIGNGILTVDTNAQAWTRARPEEADKGGDAVRAALSLVRLKRRLAMG